MRVSLLIGFGLACAAAKTPAEEQPATAPQTELSLSGHFETSLGPTALDRGVQSIGEQIDAQRAAAKTHTSPVWELAASRYLPVDPAHTLNSRVVQDDDPFFTPNYLTVTSRHLDHELKKSERAAQGLLR